MFFSLLLAFSLSVDALGVGVSYGLRRIRFPLASLLLLGTESLGMMLLVLSLGGWLASFFPFAPLAKCAAAFLFFFGLWFLKNGLSPKKEKTPPPSLLRNPSACDRDLSSAIEPKEALLLGLVLSADSLGAGLTIALSGLSHCVLPFFAAFFQALFLFLGSALGKKLILLPEPKENRYALLSGMILAIIGLYRFFSA